MLRLKLTAAVLLFFGISASLVATVRRAPRTTSAILLEQKSSSPDIEATRVKPAGEPAADIECESFAAVDFTYQVSNRGAVPITGMKLGTRCGCEDVGTPPREILPGQSAPISFRLHAPYVGRLQRNVPLVVDGASEPLAVFDVSLHVKFEPPKLVPPPAGLSITFMHGDSSTRELLLDAIEAKRHNAWVRGIEFGSADGIQVERCQVEDLPEADPSLMRRRYRFSLVNRSLLIGPHSAMATIQTAKGFPRVPEPLLVRIDVADPVAIVPNPLIIKCAAGAPLVPRRVRIINRAGNNAAVTVGDYDHELVRVVATDAAAVSMAAFDVLPAVTPESQVDAKVVFNIGGGQARELLVRLEPSEQIK